MAYILSHQTPTATSISWENVHIVYDGVDYPVADGNTNKKFVYWLKSSPNVLQTSDTYPSLTIEDAIVFINSLGIGLSVLESSVIEGSLVIPGTIQAGALAADSVSAENIVAGSITTDKIAAGAITANKIAAGAITAEKIAASSITADKIAVGTVKNLLQTSNWTSADITPLEVGDNDTSMTPTIAWKAPGAMSFGETVELKHTGTPGAAKHTDALVNEPIVVIAGARYEISGYLATDGCEARVVVKFYDSSNTYISEGVGNVVSGGGGNTLAAFERSYAFVTAPANAATAKVAVRGVYDGVETDPSVYFLRLQFGEALAGATQPSSWAAAGGGGMTIIDGDKITTGSITADKLSVANLSAISANMGNLTSGTITLDNAGHIKGGQTGYNTGSGFFMGYSGTTYKFSIGNGTTGMTWDGTELVIKGQFTAGSISLGAGFNVDNNGAIQIKSGSSGARLEIYNNVIKVFDASNVLRVKIGDLSA
jgi:hypothetical protein